MDQQNRSSQSRFRKSLRFPIHTLLLSSGVLSFILWATVLLKRPDLAYGASLTPAMLLLLIAVLAFAIVLACLLAKAFLQSERVTWPVGLALFSAIMILSPVLSDFFVKAIDSRYPLAERLMTDKVEYYCALNFEARACVNQISRCPSCVSVLDKKSRQVVALKLAAFKKSIAPETELPPLRVPASLAPKAR